MKIYIIFIISLFFALNMELKPAVPDAKGMVVAAAADEKGVVADDDGDEPRPGCCCSRICSGIKSWWKGFWGKYFLGEAPEAIDGTARKLLAAAQFGTCTVFIFMVAGADWNVVSKVLLGAGGLVFLVPGLLNSMGTSCDDIKALMTKWGADQKSFYVKNNFKILTFPLLLLGRDFIASLLGYPVDFETSLWMTEGILVMSFVLRPVGSLQEEGQKIFILQIKKLRKQKFAKMLKDGENPNHDYMEGTILDHDICKGCNQKNIDLCKNLAQFPCKHAVCFDCAKRWLLDQQCPVCQVVYTDFTLFRQIDPGQWIHRYSVEMVGQMRRVDYELFRTAVSADKRPVALVELIRQYTLGDRVQDKYALQG